MIRTVNEEPCSNCKAQTNAYDQMRGRLCPNCAGVSEPLIDHSEDIEVSASSYHISNALWEQWLEKVRVLLAKKSLSSTEKQKLLLEVRQLLYDTAVTSAKALSKLNITVVFDLPNKDARKNCSHYAECVSQLDWKTDRHSLNFSLKSCPNKCEYYVDSYSIWAFKYP